ncbi:MAG: protogloblin ApPgb [Deltaproteobacteria bacterium]|nr:protogloblin ApPgb [Deltaproteobacteria bacterium]
MTHEQPSRSIPGYRLGDPELPQAPVSSADFAHMKTACLLGDDDIDALRRSHDVLVPQTEAILDVWYGFVGSHDFLVASFVDTNTQQPNADYLSRVRARFGQWIADTARANYDDAWLRYQLEIGRRHHRVGKNRTDEVTSTPLISFRYLPLLAQPIVDTLRPFLGTPSRDREDVDAMHNAWRKSVLLQVTLWSHPYIIEGDY